MRPLIVLVDDEPMNQVAFESLLPETWELVYIQNSLEAVNEISKIDPWIVICDQRMPGISGNDILETVKAIKPFAIRIITTGYSNEKLVIDSVRQAEVHDYMTKPWNDDFLFRMEKWVALFSSQRARRQLEADLIVQEKELSDRNNELFHALAELKESVSSKQDLLRELECWIHPFVLKSMKSNQKFPLKKDLSLLVIDIIDSSKIHGIVVDGFSVRERILQMFWEVVVKHGGEIESQEGDKAYANFGLGESNFNHSRAAFAAATEFIAAIESFNLHYDLETACGIGLHLARECNVHLRQTVAHTANGVITRKKFDTSSLDVDLAHRMEAVTHSLPGSNMLMSDQIRAQLSASINAVVIDVGTQSFKGQPQRHAVSLLPSSRATAEQIAIFKSKLDANSILIESGDFRKSAA